MDKEKAALISSLIEMEHTFCKAAGKDGAVGWARFFAESGVMLNKSGKPIEGPKTIEDAIGPLFQLPELRFVWEPMCQMMAHSGTRMATMSGHIWIKMVNRSKKRVCI